MLSGVDGIVPVVLFFVGLLMFVVGATIVITCIFRTRRTASRDTLTSNISFPQGGDVGMRGSSIAATFGESINGTPSYGYPTHLEHGPPEVVIGPDGEGEGFVDRLSSRSSSRAVDDVEVRVHGEGGDVHPEERTTLSESEPLQNSASIFHAQSRRSYVANLETHGGLTLSSQGVTYHSIQTDRDTKPLLASSSVSEMEGNGGSTNFGYPESVFSVYPPSTYPGSILPTYHDVIGSQSPPPAYHDLSRAQTLRSVYSVMTGSGVSYMDAIGARSTPSPWRQMNPPQTETQTNSRRPGTPSTLPTTQTI